MRLTQYVCLFAAAISTVAAADADDELRRGMAFLDAGNYSEADLIFRTAWTDRKARLGITDSRTLDAQFNLGQTLVLKGHPEQGLDLLAPAAREYEKQFGAHDPRTLIAKTGLGMALRETGSLDSAEKLLADTAQKMENSPVAKQDRSICLSELSFAQAYLGKLKAAWATISEAILQSENDDQRQVRLFAAKGQFEVSMGRKKDSVKTLQRAEMLANTYLPEGHPEWATLYSSIGASKFLDKKFIEAEEYFRKSLKIAEQFLGPDHRETMIVVQYLAEAIKRQGRKPEAKELEIRMADAQRRNGGTVSIWSLRAK